METLGELMAVLDTCTEAQRRPVPALCLDGLTLAEIGTVLRLLQSGPCIRVWRAVRKKFINSLKTGLTNDLFSGYQVKGIIFPYPSGRRTADKLSASPIFRR